MWHSGSLTLGGAIRRYACAPTALCCVLAAAAPARALGMEVESRTSVNSSLPLVVDPAPEFSHLWLDWQETWDGAPLAMTLSDGERWRAGALRPRGELTAGLGIWRLAGALQLSSALVGFALQGDLVRGEGWKLATTVAGRVGVGGGWDLALIPAWSTRIPVPAHWQAVAFGGVRARWGQTLYEVQGPSADRSTPFASVETRDLALAPLGGLSIARWIWELRLTAGWEQFLTNRVDWEARPTGLHRDSGPFVAAMLRFRVPRVP